MYEGIQAVIPSRRIPTVTGQARTMISVGEIKFRRGDRDGSELTDTTFDPIRLSDTDASEILAFHPKISHTATVTKPITEQITKNAFQSSNDMVNGAKR